ncbi:HalOD1 output domain-containing protein [Halosimplex halophilum]|uniref:HalOD1 output domain-containing protein n=1 Tax=Halosimplex halophilum TaxID=2559572 RepID=UPI001AE3E10F|nr:HalOD1 output domain-containing protein [Halosimplex halophilum]
MEDDASTTVLSVLETVAAAERADPVDLPPLADAVDPQALNDLFEPSGEKLAPVTVRFEYCGYEVTVRGVGSVTAEPVDRPATAAATAPRSGTDAGEESLAD